MFNFFVNFRIFSKIFDFSDFRKLTFFKKNVGFEIFKIDFLLNEKIFFTQNFLWFLIYISTDARNHLEHPGSALHSCISRNAKKNPPPHQADPQQLRMISTVQS